MAAKKQHPIPNINMVNNKNQKRLRLPLLNFLLVLFCSFVLVVSTFVQIKVPNFTSLDDFWVNPMLKWNSPAYTYILVPQVPALIFIVGLLGRKLSLTSIMIYLIIGLFFLPVFALGGGLGYITEFGFGYILAYIPASFFAGTLIREKFTFVNMFLAVLAGVFTIHICGILYMLVISLLRHESMAFIKGWILSQSIVKIFYDLAVSFIVLVIAKYANKYIKYLFND